MGSHKRSSTLFEWFTKPNIVDPDPRLVIVNQGVTSEEREQVQQRVQQHHYDQDDDDLSKPIPLVSIEEFSFKSIIKSCEPLAENVINGLNEITKSYNEFLGEEIEAAAEKQKEITKEMYKVDKLTHSTLTMASNRMNKAQNTAKALNGIENLVDISEQAYSNLSSIITLLNEIDSMLPVQDRLGVPQSPHKLHYPKLHKLLIGGKKRVDTVETNILPRQRKCGNEREELYEHLAQNRITSTSTVPPSPQSTSSSSSMYRQPRRSISLSALSNYAGTSQLVIQTSNSDSLAKPVLHINNVEPITRAVTTIPTRPRNPTTTRRPRPLSFFYKPSTSSSSIRRPPTAKDLLRKVINEESI